MSTLRTLCTRCLKSSFTCYCAHVRAFRPNVTIVILQHPQERKKAIGTARMAHLCTEGSKLISGKNFTENDEVNRILSDPEHFCTVLYPGEGALNLSENPAQFPAQKKLVVFVIDGTWGQAMRMMRFSENLLKLPKICFTPKSKSQYKIRKQPKDYCVSTIEAVEQVLEILDPTVDTRILFELFQSMIEYQLKFSELTLKKRIQNFSVTL